MKTWIFYDPCYTSGMSGTPEMSRFGLFFGLDFTLQSRPFKIRPKIRILEAILQKNTKKVPKNVLKLRFGLLCGLLVASLWPLGGLEVPGTPQNTDLHDFLQTLVAF